MLIAPGDIPKFLYSLLHRFASDLARLSVEAPTRLDRELPSRGNRV
jgi:hypothetical protein